jgi:DNA-binding MarR family transcriptional regulator
MDRSAQATGSPRTGKAAAGSTLAASDVAAAPHETPTAGRAGEGTPDTGRAGEGTPDTGLAGEGTPDTGLAGEGTPDTGRAGNETLAAGVAAGIEGLIGLLRWLSPPSGLSLTATATLATLERSGPARLTALAAREGVTQPAMTQLIARLEEAGLVTRATDPADGRAVEVRITAEGQALLARRRVYRAERLTGMLAELSPEQQVALAAALPAMDALASAHRGVPLTSTQTS